MFGPSFKSSTCKTALHMAVGRMHLLKNKKEIQLKQLKKEVAKLLGDNKIDNACIRVSGLRGGTPQEPVQELTGRCICLEGGAGASRRAHLERVRNT